MLDKILFPGRCCLCDGPGIDGMDICTTCVGDLTENANACERCGFPLPAGQPGTATICGRCLASRVSFDRTVSPYLYGYPVDYIVHALKFSGEQKYARLMGDLLARAIRRRHVEPLPQLLLPVPLHGERFRERGFNQSTLIARYCARHLAIPVARRVLQRIVNTAPQTGLNRAARRSNIRRAFVLREKPPVSHVAVVDDVMTTGSTAREIAKVLKRDGVQRVDIWVFARTPD